MPAIIDPIFIDGKSSPGYVACEPPNVALDFAGAVGAHGLLILAGGAGSTIQGLNIRQFTAAGISVESSSNVSVFSCWIGVDSAGNSARGNNLGIFIFGSPDCVIGGAGCLGNVVGGNVANGIAIENGGHRAVVQGNYIGLGFDGVTPVGNGLEGLYFFNSDSIVVGGTDPTEANYITNSGAQGLHLNFSCDNATIYNNYIGVNAALDFGFGNNLNGIFLQGGSSFNEIGGIGSATEKNVVAHNGLNGIQINIGSDYNSIIGNSIFCNADSGIFLDTANIDIPPLPNLTSMADSVFGTGGTPGNTVHAYRNFTNAPDPTLCDCEAEEYLGTATIDPSGNWSVVHSLGLTILEQASVTATQTDITNNTSELFAPCAGGIKTLVNAGLNEKIKLDVYPNPASETAFISFKGTSNHGEISLIDIHGRVLHSSVFNQNEIELSVKNYPAGLYYIKVIVKEGTMIEKLLLN